MSEILVIVLPVFFIIALGYALKHTALVGDGFLFQLNRLVYYVAIPALLIYKIGGADFSASFDVRLLLGLGGSVLAVCILSYLYGAARSYPPAVLGAFCQGSFRGNLGFIGLALAFNAYGEAGLATAGIAIGFLMPAVNLFAVVVLLLPQRHGGRTLSLSFWFSQVICNPIIISCFIGIGWSLLRLPLPPVLDRTLAILTGMSLPLALISIGASFSLTELRGDALPAALAAGLKLAVLPALTFVILRLAGVGGIDFGVGILFAATPTATASYIMAQQLRADAELTGSIIMLSTLASIFTYPVCLYLLHQFGG